MLSLVYPGNNRRTAIARLSSGGFILVGRQGRSANEQPDYTE